MGTKTLNESQRLSIVKIGGNVIDDAAELKKFLSGFAGIIGKKILVHGGGKIATDLAAKLNVKQKIVNGRRITDAETLKITTMVYAGSLNKEIVALLQERGLNALGLSGADLNLVKVSKRALGEVDFGFVGDIEENGVNAGMLSMLLEAGITPVLCSITHDGKGQLYNTNADTIASVIAVALSQSYAVQLNYCFEKKGVLNNVEDSSTVITELDLEEYKKLVNNGVIAKGMIPKLDNGFNAVNKGVASVLIGHSDDLSKMINENENAGTKLIA